MKYHLTITCKDTKIDDFSFKCAEHQFSDGCLHVRLSEDGADVGKYKAFPLCNLLEITVHEIT
jgi:hypothetical protein